MDQEFIKRIVALRGDAGKKWLVDLPQIIQQYEQRWNITVQKSFKLSYNYVVPATTSDGRKAVLKISFPQNKEFATEIAALKFFNGEGAITVLQYAKENGAALLEKAEPGQPIHLLKEERQAISLTGKVIKKLHKPISKELATFFPTILDLAKAFDRYRVKFSQTKGPIPEKLLKKAEEIFKQYPKEKGEPVLLHGDLHNDNILSSQRGWLVIDPKGVVGEREYDVGTFLRNPYQDFMPGSNYEKLERRRIEQFSDELGFEKERILNWSFACAVISIIWFFEDENKFHSTYLQNAQLLDELKLK